MKTLTLWPAVFIAVVLSLAALSLPARARGAEVAFDLPSSIECRDVTSVDFAAAHPDLKMVEASLRISARLVSGEASEITEFFYSFRTEPHMRILTYSPNTTLESSVADDKIEVTNAAETSKAEGADAGVMTHPFTLGGTHKQTTKKAETTKYKQVAARDVVLASGTIDREHGVFFRLRPSRTMALEGGKEFTLVAAVPRSWRGDLCTISCAARGTKKSLISSSVVDVGTSESQVGMYRRGDTEAATIAEELRAAQETYNDLLAAQRAKESVIQTISVETARLFKNEKVLEEERALENAKRIVDELSARMEDFAH